jgi:hypothetical protein
MMNAMLFFMEFVDTAPKVCNMWKYEKVVGYMKNQLSGRVENPLRCTAHDEKDLVLTTFLFYPIF